MIKGTTQEYVSVLKKLNGRDYFLAKEYEYLDNIMLPSTPSKNMLHEGFKGGSTSSILTSIAYGTNKNGVKIEMAVFLNNLTYFQYLFYSIALFKLHSDVWNEKKLKKYQHLLHP